MPRPLRRIIATMFVALLSLLSLHSGMAGQGQDRVVTKLRRIPMPVEIRVIRTKKGVTEVGRRFSDEDDWFKELKVSIENTSGKTITYIGGGFLFPRPMNRETAQEAPPKYHRFVYGQHPQAPEKARLAYQPLSIKPGETLTVTISETDFNAINESLKKLGYPAGVKEISVNVEEIFFDDGTAW